MWRILLIAGMFVAILAVLMRTALPPSSSIISDSEPGHRMALVIGNDGYGEHPLRSAHRDAQSMSAALSSLGFSVTRRINVNQDAMQHALDSFIHRLGPRDTAFVYFAGHGIQAGGDALLLPLDASERAPATLIAKGIAVQDIVSRLTRLRPLSANIVVLDMCLNDPFGQTPARAMHLPPRTLVAFAAQPQASAAEDERNGFYSAALLRALAEEGQATSALFDTAASDTASASHGAQRPWIASTLDAGFILGTHAVNYQVTADSANNAGGPVRLRGILPKNSTEQYELAFWESIKDSAYPSDYEAYLKAYPNGRFATLAKARIERLKATASARPPAAVSAASAARPASPVIAAPAVKTNTVTNTTTKPAGNELKDCAQCPLLIPIAAGTFTMGSNSDDPGEKPPHRVTIAHPFAIGKYEVTVEQWNACADAGACTRIAPDSNASVAPPANSPMRNVSWDDAQVYVKWLSKVGGKPYRLPSEAEWELAARGGTQSTYWWGEQMKKGTADCKECGDPYRADAPTPAGSFAPNPYGLYDMNGSVWEWVADCWHSSYKGAPADGRNWDDPSCSVRVIRGGSWREGAAYMQSATRFKYSASVRQSQNGFRVARDVQ